MPRRRITFRQLETFSTVARLGSFTKAAEELHLTQPAVSIQIRQIAETIGLPLFEQNGREIALTSAGADKWRNAIVAGLVRNCWRRCAASTTCGTASNRRSTD